VEEHQTFFKSRKVSFSYPSDDVKYYLITGDSGYPLADFVFPGIPAKNKTSFVVPERITNTAYPIQESQSNSL
jgi:hypothetical protein